MSSRELEGSAIRGDIPSFDQLVLGGNPEDGAISNFETVMQIKQVLASGTELFADATLLSARVQKIKELRQINFLMRLALLCAKEGSVKTFPSQRLIDLGLVPESGERSVPRRIPEEDIQSEEERYKKIIMINARNRVSLDIHPIRGGTEYSINETYHALTDTGYDRQGRPLNYTIGTVRKKLGIRDIQGRLESTLETHREDALIVQRDRVFKPGPSERASRMFVVPVTERELRRTAAALSLGYAPTYPVERLLQSHRGEQ